MNDMCKLRMSFFLYQDEIISDIFNVLHNILNAYSKIFFKIFVFRNIFFINFDLP